MAADRHDDPALAGDEDVDDETAEQTAAEREPEPQPAAADERPRGMLPSRERRRSKIERGLMRLVATAGIVGIAVALGAILVGQDVAGWIVGLVIGLVSVVLAALLWSSRQL